jgi:hypothetical protein
VQEDRNGQIQIPGLKEVQARSADEMTQLIEYGLSERKTKSTAWNDTSSRSHAIGTISIKEINKRNQVIAESGKLLLVDLAGSEKAQDSQSNIKQRRIEGAEINTSLLSLKEWIRSMDSGKKHIPFRQSKLTMVLRDSFIGGKNKNHVIMIACISPNHNSSDHTLNTLRYAERLKCSADDEEPVEKYMTSKPIVNKSQEFYMLHEKEEISEIIEGNNESTHRDPRLYQSQDFALHMQDHLRIIPHEEEYNDDGEYESNRRPEFEDSHNMIEINPSTNKETEFKHYEPKNFEEYRYEASKTLEPEIVRNYGIKSILATENQSIGSYEDNHFNYETHGFQKRIPAKNKVYRKPYQNTEIEDDAEETDWMEVDSDGSEEHHSPQMYITKKNETSFSKMKLRNNAQSTKLDLKQSSSNSKLRYRKNMKPTGMDYKDNTRSSTSNISHSYLQRTRPTPNIELNLDSEEKEPMNRTSNDFSHRQKPIANSISYNARSGTGNYTEEANLDVDPQASSLSDRYKDLVSNSSYGKALVASYNSYFKHDREYIRPTTGGRRYNYR